MIAKIKKLPPWQHFSFPLQSSLVANIEPQTSCLPFCAFCDRPDREDRTANIHVRTYQFLFLPVNTAKAD
ncbi:MAG TPA: hypothetical protein VFH52_06680 [Rhodanobacteraceae bacterium]|nr:hypothetical protein [Rhodanobacteraceae bacterium]